MYLMARCASLGLHVVGDHQGLFAIRHAKTESETDFPETTARNASGGWRYSVPGGWGAEGRLVAQVLGHRSTNEIGEVRHTVSHGVWVSQ